MENAAKAKKNEMPTRAEVAQGIRALKDFPGITGTFSFNAIGDPTVAQYFVIKVKSADPAKWSENTVVETLNLAPPQ
jgi:ABC-type branched-subunit amino acid transport system substrate-binding protein